MGRPPANTKVGCIISCVCTMLGCACCVYVCVCGLQLAPKRIHKVRTRGGNVKYRALRLDTGNFSWGSEGEQ